MGTQWLSEGKQWEWKQILLFPVGIVIDRVTSRFMIISRFLQFEGNFVRSQNNSAPSSLLLYLCFLYAFKPCLSLRGRRPKGRGERGTGGERRAREAWDNNRTREDRGTSPSHTFSLLRSFWLSYPPFYGLPYWLTMPWSRHVRGHCYWYVAEASQLLFILMATMYDDAFLS